MGSEVVRLPQSRSKLSRDESAAMRARYEQEQASRELDAIRANRNARIRATKQAWMRKIGMVGTVTLVGGFVLGLFVPRKPWEAPPPGQGVSPSRQTETTSDTVARVVSAPVSAASAGKTASSGAVKSSMVAASPTVAVARAKPPTPTRNSTLGKVASTPAHGGTKPAIEPREATRETVLDNPKTSSVQLPVAQSGQLGTSAGVFEARTSATTVGQSVSQAVATRAADLPSYVVVGVPTDGVVMVQIGSDPTLKYVKTGQVLPDGSRLGKASAETGRYELSREK